MKETHWALPQCVHTDDTLKETGGEGRVCFESYQFFETLNAFVFPVYTCYK